MAKSEIITPQMLVVDYKQESTDEDYGSCLWAKFYFDVTNCNLLIISDCGEYGYGWYSDTKPFLNFMTEIRGDYLLKKISQQTMIDCNATFKNIKEYISELNEETERVSEYDEYSLEEACSYNTYDEVFNALAEFFDLIY